MLATSWAPMLTNLRALFYPWLIGSAVFTLVLTGTVLSPLVDIPVVVSAEHAKLSDFTYYFAVNFGWWKYATGGYEPQSIRQSLSHIFGTELPGVMPNGLSPTIILIWQPLFLLRDLSNLSFPILQCVWLALSLSVLFVPLGLRLGEMGDWSKRRITSLMIIGGSLTLASIDVVILGQTGIFALGVILLLGISLGAAEQGREERYVVIGLCLFLLSIKLPYLIIGLGICFLVGAWRGIVFGLTSIIVTTGCLSAVDGGSPVSEYVKTMGYYSVGDFGGSGFYWGNFGANSPTFINVATGYLLDFNFAALNKFIIFTLVVLFVAYSLLRRRAPVGERLVTGSVIILAAYLGFAPYIGRHEYVLALLPILMSLCFGYDSNRVVLAMISGFSVPLFALPQTSLMAQLLCVFGLLFAATQLATRRTPAMRNLPTEQCHEQRRLVPP